MHAHSSETDYEIWIRSEVAKFGYRIELPPKPTPGALALLVPIPEYPAFREFTDTAELRVWEVRGALAQPKWPLNATAFISSVRDGLRLSTIGSRAVGGFASFRLLSDSAGNVTEVCAMTEGRGPVAALARARQPLEELLDELASYAFLPTQYTHFDVASGEGSSVLAREIFLPFGPTVEVDSTTHLPPILAWSGVLNELLREGMCSSSPYYRLLCAFRLADGIPAYRKEVVAACAMQSVTASVPKPPQILKSEILERGATIDRKLARKGESLSLSELCDAWRDKRNAVAHLFFQREAKTRILTLSHGEDYRDFACSAAILLFFSRKSADDLRSFIREHITPFPEMVVVPGADMLGIIREAPTTYGQVVMRKPSE